MFGYKEDIPVLFLKPGQIFLTENMPVKEVKVMTVLGSCVSLILTNRHKGLAAMCHAFMPCCPAGKNCAGDCPDPYKYVRCAMKNMLKPFYRRGLRGREIEVKLFGGADMFIRCREWESEGGIPSVGQQNTETAQAIIRAEGLRLTAGDTGGLCGRKIMFFPRSGEIRVRRLKRIGEPDVRNGNNSGH